MKSSLEDQKEKEGAFLIIVQSWVGKGGVQTFVLNIQKMLKFSGKEAQILVYGKSSFEDAQANGFSYFPGYRGLFHVIYFVFRYRAKNIILNQPKSLIFAPLLSLLGRVDYVVHIDSDRFLGKWYRAIYFRLFTSMMNGFIYVMSRENISKLTEKYNVSERKLKFVKPPLFFETSSVQFAHTDRPFDIIFYGRLADQKDPFKFIEVCDAIAAEIDHLKVCIVGDGPLRQQVNSRLEVANFEYTQFYFVDQQAGFKLLRQAKIFCLTSTHEGLGFTLLESAFNGAVPVSGPISSGPKELISKIGVPIPSLEVFDYRDIIVGLLNDQERLFEAQKRAILAAQEYRFDKVIDGYFFADQANQ